VQYCGALDEDEQAVALCRSIISIAEALGLDTVAEGVETSTQLQTLRRLGCQVVQGTTTAELDYLTHLPDSWENKRPFQPPTEEHRFDPSCDFVGAHLGVGRRGGILADRMLA
jgi:EAL domain-containing protein (putative c-di-GMP-specific phosphodiesterase class I)